MTARIWCVVALAWAPAACVPGTGGDATGTTASGSGSDAGSTTSGTTGGTTQVTEGGTVTVGGGEGTWATFTKFPDREFRGQIFDGAWVASDPCVLKDGATYRMFYTCVAGADLGGLCGVTSPDGVAWTPVESIDPFIDGLVAVGRPGVGWDENMETCAIRKDGATYSLFYSGYPDLDANQTRGPAALGLMTSSDGVHFTRDPDAPVLSPDPGGPDGDDIFSAVTSSAGASLDVVYVGYCVDGWQDGVDCLGTPAIQLLGATRDPMGQWTKRSEPVFATQPDVPWLANGVAEPDVVLGPDGQYYLFLTGGLADDEPRNTGVAVGPTAFGPWQLNPTPVLEADPGAFDACGAFAPSVVIEGDKVRMWYLGMDDCAGACTSCFFGQCGCSPRFTIGYAEAPWPLYTP